MTTAPAAVQRSTTLFEVDPVGLAKLFDHRGKGMAVVELVSNAFDTQARNVEVTLKRAKDGRTHLSVTDDDPDGFRDLRHAYTLFAESIRKDDPTTRGRYNMGEKLIIVVCDECEIRSTTGTVRFSLTEGRAHVDERSESGSRFDGILNLTGAEYADGLALLRRLIPPDGVRYTVNGVVVGQRRELLRFEASLITVKGDVLRRTERKTLVRVFEPLAETEPTLFELGVPVVATGDRFDVDIAQKVPLNMERDNVTPGYLRTLRMELLNHTYAHLSSADMLASWVGVALEHPKVSREAVTAVVATRFGDKRVSYDPSDREGTKIAASQGYTVIPTGAFSHEQWDAIRRSEAVLPAGRVTPSPSLVVSGMLAAAQDGDNRFIDPEKWSAAENAVAQYTRQIGRALLGFEPRVLLVSEITIPFAALWENGSITFNKGKLGNRWFDAGIRPEVDALVLHEFAHHRVHDHLSAAYADETARLGSLLVQIALDEPTMLRALRATVTA